MEAVIEKPKQARQSKAASPVPAAPLVVPRTYTKDEVLAMFKVCWRTIQRWIKASGFPPAKKLSACNQVFLADAVDAWFCKRLGVTP